MNAGRGLDVPDPLIRPVAASSRTAVSSSCIAPCRYLIDSRIAAASSFGQPANSGVLPGACFSISNLTANLIRNPPSFGVAAATLGRLISNGVDEFFFEDNSGDEASLASAKTKKSQSQEEGQLTVDVYQTDDDIVVRSTIAGVTADDFDISIAQDMVTIKGSRKPEEKVSS